MKKIGILYGGFSSEFEISKKSALSIYSNFPKGYIPYLIEVKKEQWEIILNDTRYEFNPWGFAFVNDTNEQEKIDAALIYIHGNPGENGKIQALLDMQDIPYINSGSLSSELSFDKWYCNQFLQNFNIPVAKSILYNSIEEVNTNEIINKLYLPCFVKPSDSGSSYGISKVSKSEEIQNALNKAFEEGGAVVVESFLKGTEVTCGVYQTKSGIHTLPITEIVTENDFFDFEAKYLGKSEEITPARISKEEEESVKEIAQKVYQLLKLKSIARIDFMLVDKVPHVIEVNTTPGFSSESIVPKMLKCADISIIDFWRDIIDFELTN